MKKRLFGLAMALTIIQGCSGGSGAKTSSELLETYGYKELQKAGLDVFASNYAVNESYVSNLPKGKMQYNGVAAFTATAPAVVAAVTASGTGNVSSNFIAGQLPDTVPIPNAIGHMQVDADFAAKTATGKITNIQVVSKKVTSGTNTNSYLSGPKMGGQIDIKNGVIQTNELTASFVGNLSNEGNPEIYEGTLKGIFVGGDGGGLYGDFDSGTIAGGAALSLKGGFLTEANK